jgi:serine/threonine protein kinase
MEFRALVEEFRHHCLKVGCAMVAIEQFLERPHVNVRGNIKSPHKFILILSILEIMDEDVDHPNQFKFEEIEPVFQKLFDDFYPSLPKSKKALEFPFVHLQHERFWLLKVKDRDYDENYLYPRLTKNRILKLIDYAYLDDEHFNLIKSPHKRTELKNKVVAWLIQNGAEHFAYDELAIGGRAMKESTSLFLHEQEAMDKINYLVSESKLGELVSNITLYDQQSTNFYEYDLILISKARIFVIELKHWSGNIQIQKQDPLNWQIGEGRYRRNPHIINAHKCKILKGIYQHQFKTFPNIWVESIVVFTNPDSTIEGATNPQLAISEDQHNLTFSSIFDFIAFLKKFTAQSDTILDTNKIGAVSSYLVTISEPRKTNKYSVPGFETIEYLSQRADCIEFIARPIAGKSRHINRFRVFIVPHSLPTIEQERFKKIAFNTFEAVSRAADHPNILKVWLVPNEDGNIIEGSDWSEAGTLRDLISSYKQDSSTMTNDMKLNICYGIAQGLVHVHKANVIHRALKPENILVANGIPKLINFDLSYQYEIEELEHLTVIADTTILKDDGYTAPEVLSGQDIDERTDLFSFGVILFEVFAGSKPFASIKEFQSKGGYLLSDQIKKLEESGTPQAIRDFIEKVIIYERRDRISSQEAMNILGNILVTERGQTISKANAKLSPNDQHDLFRIDQLIGEGAEAQIYGAHTINDKAVVIKLFNKETPLERINNEAKILSSINSSYVVGFDKMGYWNNDRFFIVMEHIDGESLRKKIERMERPGWSEFETLVQCLFEGLRSFHDHTDENNQLQPFIHNDIKPENILITDDKKAVIIDCGIASEPKIDTFQGTIGYVPPDCIVGSERQFSAEGDLFALGVTLWEWLFGEKPYDFPAINKEPKLPGPLGEDFPPQISDWLLKSVMATREERFQTIAEMAQSFEEKKNQSKEEVETTHSEAVKDITPSIITDSYKNPFVHYINSMTNASAGNENAIAEAQVGNPYFEKIRVPNPIADFVFDQIRNNQSVILTGNAGDGKTTIAEEVCRRFGAPVHKLKKKIEINEGRIVVIKDMSEFSRSERIAILQEAIGKSSRVFLIVSNTGALLECGSEVSVAQKEKSELSSMLLEAMSADEPTEIYDGRVLLVNIGRLDSIDIACKAFRLIVESDEWVKCRNCNRHEVCPILFNMQLISDNSDVVFERIALLYYRLYSYGERLTLRQMIGHLAYTLTAGVKCDDIIKGTSISLQENRAKYLFFNNIFGDSGTSFDVRPESEQLLPVRLFRRERFGSKIDSRFESTYWLKRTSAFTLQSKIAESLQDDLFRQLPSEGKNIRNQLRRLIYFCGQASDDQSKKFIAAFTNSPMLISHYELCRSGKANLTEPKERHYRNQILQVLQEHFIDYRFPDGAWKPKDLYITLNRRGSSSGTQMILANFDSDDFYLSLLPSNRFIGGHSKKLCLKYKEARLELDLPFLDYVIRRKEGEIAAELSPYYADRINKFKANLLEIFREKQQKQQHNRLRLLSIDSGGKYHISEFYLDNGKLEVLG